MREFHIYAFDLGKKADLTGIFNQLYERYSPRKLIFEARILLHTEAELVANAKMVEAIRADGYEIEEPDWDKLAKRDIASHKKFIEPFEDYSYKHIESEYDASEIVSNLDLNWKFPNPNGIYDSISEAQALLLLTLAQKRERNYSSVILGLDGIDWDGSELSSATYGFEKAHYPFDNIWSYLSPSILLIQGWKGKYKIFVTFELKRTNIGNNSSIIQEHVDALKSILGEPFRMETRFAPDDESERPYWDRVELRSETVFEHTVNEKENLVENGGLPHSLTDHFKIDYKAMHANPEYKKLINIKPIVKNAFKNTRWYYRKLKGRGHYFVTEDSDGTEYEIYFVTLEKGHHLQSGISIKGRMFQFRDSVYSIYLMTEEEITKFAENAVFLYEQIYNELSVQFHEIIEGERESLNP